MFLFNRKKKINTLTMMHLVYETGKDQSKNIFGLLDKFGILHNNIEVQIKIVAINYELCRYSLYKSNKKEAVDNVLNSVYNQLFYNLNLSKEQLDDYKRNISLIEDSLKEIFNIKNKEEYIYQLILKQLLINENNIEETYTQDFLSIIKIWIDSAEGINKAYSIKNHTKSNKNEYIDFRF